MHEGRGAKTRGARVELLTEVGIADPAPAARRLSAPAFRRPAPARDDRDGARQSSRRSSSPTNRPPRSTSPCRRRSSTCCASCRQASRMAMLLITHDLGIVRKIADDVCGDAARPDRRGGPTSRACSPHPRHPYTRALLAAEPKGERRRGRSRRAESSSRRRQCPRLVSRSARAFFDAPSRDVKAVDGVSIDVREGQTLGVVGESGSGQDDARPCDPAADPL